MARVGSAVGRSVVGAAFACALLFAFGVHAQTRPAGYADAELSFHQHDISQRVHIQVLLTAAGYWNAVPNERFNGRIYEAIVRFQAANDFTPNAVLDTAQIEALARLAAPSLSEWGLSPVSHPFRSRQIWAPNGLGLTRESTTSGVKFMDRLKRVSLSFDYFAGDLKSYFQTAIGVAERDGGRIHFKVLRPDFYAISYSRGELDGYMRFQADAGGIVGFFLMWRNDAKELHGDRLATLISGSLSASSGRTPVMQVPISLSNSRPPATRDAPASPVKPPDKHSPGSGSGFFISNSGHILTNAHVTQDCRSISAVAAGGSTISARVVALDRTNDLAVIHADVTPKRVASLKTSPKLGQPVAAFGFPLNTLLASSGNFTLGNITAIAGLGDDVRYVQMSAPVQAGNSGGPLVDDEGNVIGVVTATLKAIKTAVESGNLPQNVNFAIKSSIVIAFLEANRIEHAPVSTSAKMTPVELAEHTREMSVFVRCN